MIHIENTTIEEQIAYEKDFAKFCLEQAKKWKNKDLDEYGYHMKTYRECTNKYRWLEELQAHREAWMKVVSEVDQHTEIHSDGEFYIKNFDVKKIIAEYRPKGARNEDITL